MSARELVMDRLVNEVRRFPELDLTPLNTEELDDRDAALAMAIDQSVRRHWLTLVTVLESQLSRPWAEVEAKVQAALLAGAAQLLYLDRLPDHAVINDTVEWTKQQVRTKAGGMVNAVLRKVAALRGDVRSLNAATDFARSELPRGDGRVMTLTEPLFAEHSITRLAQQTSHPETLIARWLHLFGESATHALAKHSVVQPPIILSGANGSANPELIPHSQPGYHVFRGDHAALMRLLATNPSVIVHDPASAAPILAVRDLNVQPRTIIDVCAGKGTKTRLLARVFPDARIIATDIDTNRLSALRRQFDASDRVRVIDFAQLQDHHNQADLLVLDVPCSNTGVLARRVEARYRYSAKTMEKLAATQRQILADTILLLTTKGQILYITCSVDVAENEQQSQWLKQWHRLKIAESGLTIPSGLPGESASGYHDGGYWALLQR
jgi:16S rRNA (cytosine967-C5)-methyltransferase